MASLRLPEQQRADDLDPYQWTTETPSGGFQAIVGTNSRSQWPDGTAQIDLALHAPALSGASAL